MSIDTPRPPALPLFRPEVLAARREPTFGAAILVQPVGALLLSSAAVALALCMAVLVWRGEYTRKARVSGYLVPTRGLIKVYSRETGTIVEKRVSEGLVVSKGDVLFVVSMERGSREAAQAQTTAMATLRERRTSLRTELGEQGRIARIDADSLRQQIAARQTELGKISEAIATQQRRVASAQVTHQMYQSLLEKSLGSREQLEEKQKDVLDQQGKLEGLQRDQIAASRDLDGFRAQLASFDVKARTERSATERDISALDQQLTEYESRRSFVVTAPADGTATAVLADIGQTAVPSQPLVSVLPAGAVLQAHLLVPSSAIGFVAPAQTVALRYQAFSYQRFGSYLGRVTEVSKTLILPGEATLPIQLPEPAYRVTVALGAQSVAAYGQAFPLQSGMLLDANIWLDRRKLYQWLLDPLYSIKGKV